MTLAVKEREKKEIGFLSVRFFHDWINVHVHFARNRQRKSLFDGEKHNHYSPQH
jgi:hypothetical protein